MAAISEPEGISSFSDNLSSFNNEQVVQVSEPTAAVQSASSNVVKKVSIIENPTFLNSDSKVVNMNDEAESEDEESNVIDTVKNLFDENQTMIMLSVAVFVGYYFYKKNKK